jgi:hypothetical protein
MFFTYLKIILLARLIVASFVVFMEFYILVVSTNTYMGRGPSIEIPQY